MASRATVVAATLLRAHLLGRAWMGKGDGSRTYTPWMPFPQPAFISMLAEAVTAVAEYGGTDGDGADIRFTEIGCGPGPNLMIARELFGLDVLGIDRNREYVSAAASLGYAAEVADAEKWTGYAWPHVTWFNRVARPADIQSRIEAAVWRGTRPGGIVMCANLEAPPPPSWLVILDEWEDVRRGIWRKPDMPAAGW